MFQLWPCHVEINSRHIIDKHYRMRVSHRMTYGQRGGIVAQIDMQGILFMRKRYLLPAKTGRPHIHRNQIRIINLTAPSIQNTASRFDRQPILSRCRHHIVSDTARAIAACARY